MGGLLLVEACRLLTAAASLAVEHRLCVVEHELKYCSSLALEHRLSTCGTRS